MPDRRPTTDRPAIDRIAVETFTIPTDAPEADGTFGWDHTVLVVVSVEGGGRNGLGYGYADRATARLIAGTLGPLVTGMDALDVNRAWIAMTAAVRNLGRPGIASMAIAAVDAALWDLKGKLFGRPVADLLGRARDATPAYGSGGFTSYSDRMLADQLAGWAGDGLTAVKMKIGGDPATAARRAAVARGAIGDGVDLYVDANGACSRKAALATAEALAGLGVTWFEEPVSSDDLEGLRLVRDRGPAGMAIAAGEYGYTPAYFRRMLEAGAVDVIQADATRCGITGFLAVAALAEAFATPLSAHTAPSLHTQVACACRPMMNIEYFHDHARIERMLFEGAAVPRNGLLAPDPGRPGLGLDFKRADAERFRDAG
ncbi:enolase C-terminal domain-like protein [Azospirillum picis]|uniref:L-alanine-DL-glutamate epimerase-like enolase superfamily enzyme n=1 Tax=Azospirillum picis TaxID=488438 RepID=A0ABU0MHW2_9PROT|nr:enolase C-terminal domain-like protein [Azospirillum picis]MBP2298957.1 L-alanine-DL-glutamate epimerase-like enolase superfamily enzyme [Azospirillum picis]MDQ0532801.1 L-alanine-DL-glutamate epimerase-like enolase superfamily enzyme [Azospirillum picis]